ncbi:CDP-alcohol phosphatidyltransferase family protein [Leifsonia sp. AG29]|uniref:CDP-alcohol phosphatidyltransferase family protein n=1 Tax=Leifsonia sp. AG29 TaxID=2598860 RepID=UPI00131CE821|nr:CDP-alcohol phosphatidyltransferase family protein [Leifsonia sp. AG29]
MKRVQQEALGWAAAGAGAGVVLVGAVLAVDAQISRAAVPALFVALVYLAISNALLARALRRTGAERFGAANVVTSLRSTLVGFVTALVVASLVVSVPAWLLVALTVPALSLDAVDGWVARRTRTVTEVGARFDMEVDAFLLLVLSAYAATRMGGWVLAIGLLRYAFVVAGWALPWMRRSLPYRYWRKVVTAFAGIALAFAASGLLPGVAVMLVVIALGLLVESFGRDVVWLARRRSEVGAAVPSVSEGPAPRTAPEASGPGLVVPRTDTRA